MGAAYVEDGSQQLHVLICATNNAISHSAERASPSPCVDFGAENKHAIFSLSVHVKRVLALQHKGMVVPHGSTWPDPDHIVGTLQPMGNVE